MPDEAVRLPARTQSSAQLQSLIENLADTQVNPEARQKQTQSMLDAWLGSEFQCATQAHRLLNHITELSGKAWDPMRNALMAALRPAMQKHSPQVAAGEDLARHGRHDSGLRDLAQSKVQTFALDNRLSERQRFDLRHRVDQKLREALLGDLAALTYAELGSEACLTAAGTAKAYLVFDHLPELSNRFARYEISERYAPMPDIPDGMRAAGMSLLYMFMLGDSEPGVLRIGISRR